MKKLITVLVVLFIGILGANAQSNNKTMGSSDYQSAIGIRFGEPISGSFKYFITKAGALEANAGFWHDPVAYGFNYFRLGVMYQHHFPIANIPGFRWYVGGGAFVQFFSYNKSFGNGLSSTIPGINGVGGVDYKIRAIPLNLSVDWTPTIFLGNTYYNSFGPGYGGISVRYTLK